MRNITIPKKQLTQTNSYLCKVMNDNTNTKIITQTTITNSSKTIVIDKSDFTIKNIHTTLTNSKIYSVNNII